MDGPAAEEIFRFESFRLDQRAGGLFRADENGALVPVAIGTRALDLLTLLVRRHGDVVSKDEVMAAVWPEMIVEDSNLPTQISALRRVLDRGRSNGSCIQTIAGRGYRFVAALTHPAGEEPLVALQIRPEAIADLPASNSPIAAPRRRSNVPAIALVLAALVIAAGAWWLWPTTQPSPLATSIPAPLVSPRLSIVVLPFTNLSNDPGQQYFADGIVDDLTTQLSQIPDSFVISRNTAFAYRDKPADTKQLGRELGVRYVLEGSVQRSGSQVRVNAQLINAESDALLWAEQFDRDTADLFALQDEITGRIRNTLGTELIAAEAARRTERPDALDYIFRARATMTKPPSRGNYAEAIGLFERALALDRQSIDAQSSLASVLAGRLLNNMTDSPAADLERAKALSEEALAAWPRSPLAHYAKGQALRAERRYAEAIPEYEAVLASNRNSAYSFFNIGNCKFHTGFIDETIPLVERAIRLSPRDPFALGTWYQQIGFVHLLQSHADEAIIWLEKARNHSPALSFLHAQLASAYALNGEIERAAAELAEARRLSPDDRFSSLARSRAAYFYLVPKIRALMEATYFTGLRTAGMPEE